MFVIGHRRHPSNRIKLSHQSAGRFTRAVVALRRQSRARRRRSPVLNDIEMRVVVQTDIGTSSQMCMLQFNSNKSIQFLAAFLRPDSVLEQDSICSTHTRMIPPSTAVNMTTACTGPTRAAHCELILRPSVVCSRAQVIMSFLRRVLPHR